MAGYSGFFMKGMAGGLQSGVNMGMQLTQMKWQKKKQKELEDMTVKMNDTWNSIGQELITLANDGQLSEDDKLKVYALTIAAPYEMQGVMQNLRSSLAQFDTKGFDNQMELVKTFYDYAQGLNIKDIDSLYETFRGQITDPHALTLFEVADKKLRHEYEVAQAQPKTEVFPSAEALREKYPNAGVKHTEQGYVPTFGEVKPTEPQTELDKMEETKKWLDSAYATGNAAYFNRVAKEKGVPTTFDTYKQKYEEPEVPGTTPEGEITAGQKRSWDMASSVMFGSSDWVTGISKPGIISQSISNKLNMGDPLTNEENAEIRNNYNAIKETLPDEIKSVIESQLQRYGISLEAPAEAEVLLDIKKKPFWQSEQKYYQGLTVEELYQLADKEDDKKAYEELKKRGLIK